MSDPFRGSKNVHVLAVIDNQSLVYYEIITGKYDATKYAGLLREIRDRVGENEKIAFFADGLSLHFCKEIK